MLTPVLTLTTANVTEASGSEPMIRSRRTFPSFRLVICGLFGNNLPQTADQPSDAINYRTFHVDAGETNGSYLPAPLKRRPGFFFSQLIKELLSN